MEISIHALRVESDEYRFLRSARYADFYPRPPGGGRRDLLARGSACTYNFYPRPPGGGRHLKADVLVEGIKDFYPRPPGGGRRGADKVVPGVSVFLSTPSGWRATGKEIKAEKAAEFLSTPSGWRATRRFGNPPISCRYFYPRPPGGGRPGRSHSFIGVAGISIHALRVEGDLCDKLAEATNQPISIHALRVEGD